MLENKDINLCAEQSLTPVSLLIRVLLTHCHMVLNLNLDNALMRIEAAGSSFLFQSERQTKYNLDSIFSISCLSFGWNYIQVLL